MARSRGPLGIFLPLLLVLVAAGLWAVAWFVLAGEAESRVEAALTEASARGQTLDCAEKIYGGFPFRVEFDCRAPRLVLEDAESRVTVSAEGLKAVALVYNLEQIIAELTGPTEIETFRLGGERHRYRVASATARASFEVPGGALDAASAVATGVEVLVPPLGLLNTPETSYLSLARAEFHLRRAEGGAHDVALELDDTRLAGELATVWFETPELEAARVDFVGRLTQTAALGELAPAEGLPAWQKAGGEVLVQRFGIDSPALDVEISGSGRLDAAGRAEGKFKGVFGRLDRLVADLKARGVLDEDGARMAAGVVGLLARPVQGTSKAELPVKVEAGEVFLGPIKTMVLPPLF